MNRKLVYVVVILTLVLAGVAVYSVLRMNQSPEAGVPVRESAPPQRQINIKTLEIGQKAPDFSITSIDGETLTLSGFKDKIVVVTSGAAWCPTCIIENKNFQPVYEETKDKGVEFITVDIDPADTPEAVLKFQETYAPWHNVHVDSAWQMINDYGFWRFEITYIIDGDGVIQFADIGITSEDKLRKELNKLI